MSIDMGRINELAGELIAAILDESGRVWQAETRGELLAHQYDLMDTQRLSGVFSDAAMNVSIAIECIQTELDDIDTYTPGKYRNGHEVER